MSKRRTFVARCLEGEALFEEIDDEVARWHASSDRQHLHEFLGLSRSEYRLWVEQPEALKFILFARKSGKKLSDVLDWHARTMAVAARAADASEAKKVIAWLQSTDRWDDNT